MVRVTWEQYSKKPEWGFIGSVIGVLFAILSTYQVITQAGVPSSALILYRLLFLGWFIFQGIGFFAVSRRYRDVLSFVAFEFGLLSALSLAAAYARATMAFGGAWLLNLLFCFAEAMYLIMGGGSVISVGRRTNQAAPFTLAGIVFIIAGALIGLGRFLPELGTFFFVAWYMYESGLLLVIVVNILACLVFYNLMAEGAVEGMVAASDSGAGIQ